MMIGLFWQSFMLSLSILFTPGMLSVTPAFTPPCSWDYLDHITPARFFSGHAAVPWGLKAFLDVLQSDGVRSRNGHALEGLGDARVPIFTRRRSKV